MVRSIRYGETVNLGNYESMRVDVEVFPEEVESFKEAHYRASQLVQEIFTANGVIDRQHANHVIDSQRENKQEKRAPKRKGWIRRFFGW
jgi:hypothetical protein